MFTSMDASKKLVDIDLEEKKVDRKLTGRNITKIKTNMRKNFQNVRFNTYHLALITFIAFWAGVAFTHYIINSSKIDAHIEPTIGQKEMKKNAGNDDSSDEYKTVDETSDHLFTREERLEETENTNGKKLILLHGDDIWTKYDKWNRHDWRKCPPKYSNCRITTDKRRINDVDAVVYNAVQMPDVEHVNKVKSDPTLKRIFLSGITPMKTTFEPSEFNDFFDITITYKADSSIRIPFWPNDGLLPAMYRPKPPGKSVEGEDLIDLEDDVSHYFAKFGKDNFMSYTIKDCTDNHYPTLFVGKLREEGQIDTFSYNDSSQCIDRIKETKVLPCQGIDTDDCVKHFEKYKFTIVADEDFCLDYTTRDYWVALFAWQSVPLLYGAANYEKFLIPNSYIDCVGKEDYISPAFKKAYGPSQNDQEYYKKFQLWRDEDRVEEFHWQCDLCKTLSKGKSVKKVKMEEFWNKEKDCGSKLDIHESMRLQLVRTGVISG